MWVLIDDENRQAIGPFPSEAEAELWAAQSDWPISEQGDPVGWYTIAVDSPS